MKYLSLIFFFCFLALFSCEREDAFPETHGPVEPETFSAPGNGELESVLILSSITADIDALSAYFDANFKDLTLLTETDLESAASFTGVSLLHLCSQVQRGLDVMNEHGNLQEEVAEGVVGNALISGSLRYDKLPCLEAYKKEMTENIQATVECGVGAENPSVALACTLNFIIRATVADNNFDRCLAHTYPNP